MPTLTALQRLRTALRPLSPAPEREGFRQAMSWLHTWAGLVLGWLLFAIFLTGTLSFFRAEFSLWMRPELTGLPTPAPDLAEKVQASLQAHSSEVRQWILTLPDERQAHATLLWRDSLQGRFETLFLHPDTGAVLQPRATLGGDFFYRFHFELRTAQKGRWVQEGRWLVGGATLAMLVALLSGIVTHRRFFKDFFTWRPGKGGQRAWLDAHNVSGVLVLPFYLLITFSGLMIFHTLYLPTGIASTYRTHQGGVDSAAYLAELQGEKPEQSRRAQPSAGLDRPLPTLPLTQVLAQARLAWPEGRVGSLQARRDAQGQPLIEVVRHEGDRLQYRPQRLLFDGLQGHLLQAVDAQGPAVRTYGVLYGLHMARFADTGLRWALFALGLLGSGMIATGLVLWSVKRDAQAQRKPGPRPWGHRLVASLNIATLAGLPLACAALLWANRLLPLDTPGRPDAELGVFFGTWGLGLAWALWQAGRRGWCGLWAANGLAWLGLPLLHLLTSAVGIPAPLGWMSLSMGLVGTLAAALAWRLRSPTTHHHTRHTPPLSTTVEVQP